jgi:hypothetical protein
MYLLGTKESWDVVKLESMLLIHMTPPCENKLSFWEEEKLKRHIDALIKLGKMKPSTSKYACRVTLPIKKDGNRQIYGDYRALDLQTCRNAFPMLLVEDVLN